MGRCHKRVCIADIRIRYRGLQKNRFLAVVGRLRHEFEGTGRFLCGLAVHVHQNSFDIRAMTDGDRHFAIRQFGHEARRNNSPCHNRQQNQQNKAETGEGARHESAYWHYGRRLSSRAYGGIKA